MALESGARVGPYEIVAPLGAGGMGEVYSARDTRLGRTIAIKILPAEFASDAKFKIRFEREARAISALNHPNICALHDVGSDNGLDYLVMEQCEGETLARRLTRGHLPIVQVIEYGMQIANALDEAHRAGIIHRDLKPSNIMITRSGVKLLDFGLAKQHIASPPEESTASMATEEGKIPGTIQYMAPEVLSGNEADARSDIFALGLVLYEMVTGTHAFSGTSRASVIAAILEHEPKSVSELQPAIPPALDRLIRACLAKDPASRIQSAHDISLQLQWIMQPKQYRSAERPHLPARRTVIALTVAAVLVVAAMVAWRIGLVTAGKRVAQPAQVAPSIAVLPFADISPGKDQEYFSDGLAEELLNTLARTPELRVTARTSSFQFKGKNEDLRVIGRKLNVATVLEGSVRTQGNRIRINVELVRVSDGYSLWSQSYDRDLKDVFAIQDEVARSVTETLKVTLLGAKMPAPRATNPQAYSAYLQGRYFQQKGNKEDFEKAMAYYREAIRLDAKYALAWAALADARSYRAARFIPWPELRTETNQAREEAQRAIALDPTLGQAYAVLGWIKQHDLDWTGAEALYQRALALSPGQADILLKTAYLAAILTRFDESSRLYRRAIELDPLNTLAYVHLTRESLWRGHLEDAEAAAHKALEINPKATGPHSGLSQVYLLRSRPQEALAEAELESHPVFHLERLALAYDALGRRQESDRALKELIAKYETLGAVQIAQVYAARGEIDKAFDWLERAYTYHDTALCFLKAAPGFKNLRNDPRYAIFMEKIHLPLS